MESKSYKIYQVPSAKSQQKEIIIGLIDSSGSMYKWWETLANHWNKYVPKENCYTICFSTNIHLVPSNKLSTRIQDHGGCTTNILKGFLELEKKIAE
jgi:uncharacterized protein with von Willebrand factor type A (vWA) domain